MRLPLSQRARQCACHCRRGHWGAPAGATEGAAACQLVPRSARQCTSYEIVGTVVLLSMPQWARYEAACVTVCTTAPLPVLQHARRCIFQCQSVHSSAPASATVSTVVCMPTLRCALHDTNKCHSMHGDQAPTDGATTNGHQVKVPSTGGHQYLVTQRVDTIKWCHRGWTQTNSATAGGHQQMVPLRVDTNKWCRCGWSSTDGAIAGRLERMAHVGVVRVSPLSLCILGGLQLKGEEVP